MRRRADPDHELVRVRPPPAGNDVGRATPGAISQGLAAEGLLRLLCDRVTYEQILAGKPVDAIIAGWNDELAEFQKVRSRYLLY